MPPKRFTDIDIPSTLDTSSGDIIEDFFVPMLQNASYYDRGVGFFSSGWIRLASQGLSAFAENGGRARWVTSPILSKNDWKALKEGSDAREDQVLFQALERNIVDLQQSLDESTLDALAWMVADGILEFRLAVPRNKLDGEFHDKFGVFQDFDGNRVSFNGSYNDSIQGTKNYESIKIFTSWSEYGQPLVQNDAQRFNNLWMSQDLNIKTYQLNDESISGIIKLRKYERPYKESKSLAKPQVSEPGLSWEKARPAIPHWVNLYDYQERAIEKWINNGYQGFFEMATGTGKTITALSCAVRLFSVLNSLVVIVIVPTLPLASQWYDEIMNFGFVDIVSANSKNSRWSMEIQQMLNRARRKPANFFVITTYKTFAKKQFQGLIKKFPEYSMLIADEAHNFGASSLLEVFPPAITYRIGLSATPERQFDRLGTATVLEYFNSVDEPTFQFTMSEAIDQGYLCRYYYHPYAVHLNQIENTQYKDISRGLLRYFNSKTKKFDDSPIVLQLLLKRKRIIHKAENKIPVLRTILADIKNSGKDIKYTLVYVPEGKPNVFEATDQKLINEYSRVISEEFDIAQHQYIGVTDNRQEILKEFASGTISVLTAMKCLDEGIDVKRTEIAIFGASTGNPRQFIQRRGRILRTHPKKRFATIYDMIVIPTIPQSNDMVSTSMEASILKSELRRIHEFAGLAENKFQALKSLEKIFDLFDIDVFSLEDDKHDT